MARRKDAEEDRASRIVLDQLNTKTVGAPPSSTGLTGDQLPDTIFSVDNFDLVKNQVTLQLQNLELLNVLNTIGQITNTQSQSGPIPGTAVIETIQATTSGTKVAGFRPDPGTVFQLYAFSVSDMSGRSGSCLHEVYLRDMNNDRKTELIDVSVGSSVFPLIESGTSYPVFIDNNLQVQYEVTGTFTDSTLVFIAMRVR